jgi:hypothetical protein
MQKRNDDDDDPILRDGERMRVPMTMVDSWQREMTEHFRRPRARLHDGRGNPVGQRPGFVVSDAITSEERQRIHDAYEAYEDELTTAWKRGAV